MALLFIIMGFVWYLGFEFLRSRKSIKSEVAFYMSIASSVGFFIFEAIGILILIL